MYYIFQKLKGTRKNFYFPFAMQLIEVMVIVIKMVGDYYEWA